MFFKKNTQISYFQYFASFFTEVNLATFSTKHNPNLELKVSKGRLKLDTPNATYSFEDLYINFFETFKYLKIKEKNFKEVLILGMGLGSIPLMLYQNFNQTHAHFTGVEIDEVIADLVQKYLPTHVLQKTNIVKDNALTFLEQNNPQTPKYDLIIVDVFIDDQTPAIFQTPHFLQLLQKNLLPHGLIIYNTLSSTAALNEAVQKFYTYTFKQFFSTAQIFKIYGNKMLLFESE